MIEQYAKYPVKYLDANGISYAYIEEGAGELVVLLHGFPDSALTFQDLIPAFVQNGYRVILPFLRGYYPTAISEEDDYSIQSVAEDILALLSELNHEKFYLIGHDWGASISYVIANLQANRVKKLVTIAVPHPSTINMSMTLAYKARHFFFLRFKTFSNWYTRRKNFDYIDFLIKSWAPDWNISPEYRAMIKVFFSLPGRLDAALGYYRSFVKDGSDKAKQALYNQKTDVPALTFAGRKDGAMMLEHFKKMKNAFTKSCKIEIVEDAGHFIHQEKPELFMKKTLAFFQQD